MTALTVAYGPAAAAGASLLLEQVEIPAVSQSANLADIVAMYRYVITGLSARTYKAERCPVSVVDGVVTCRLQLMVFPTNLDLSYRLETSNGVIGPAVELQAEREFDLIVPMTDRVDLGFLVEDFTVLAATGFYDPSGALIQPPALSLSGSVLRLSQKCFAVLRIGSTARGYRHDIDISVDKAEGYKIENLASKVQATWMSAGELASTDIDLVIPDCVNALLAYCPDGDLATNVIYNPNDSEIPVVRYNQCTGAFLGVHYE